MAARREVAIENRGAWGLEEFAVYISRSYSWVHERIVWEPDGCVGVLNLPGGVHVPVHRDVNRWALIYRRQWEQAIDKVPAPVLHWDGHQAVEA